MDAATREGLNQEYLCQLRDLIPSVPWAMPERDAQAVAEIEAAFFGLNRRFVTDRALILARQFRLDPHEAVSEACYTLFLLIRTAYRTEHVRDFNALLAAAVRRRLIDLAIYRRCPIRSPKLPILSLESWEPIHARQSFVDEEIEEIAAFLRASDLLSLLIFNQLRKGQTVRDAAHALGIHPRSAQKRIKKSFSQLRVVLA